MKIRFSNIKVKESIAMGEYMREWVRNESRDRRECYNIRTQSREIALHSLQQFVHADFFFNSSAPPSTVIYKLFITFTSINIFARSKMKEGVVETERRRSEDWKKG
jgi:hypothetical protein